MSDKPIKMGMMPAPPGEFVREQILEPLNLSISKAAQIVQVRRATLSDIVNGKVRLNSDVAFRLEKAFGISMELLMQMQTSYEIAQIRQSSDDVDISPYHPV